MNSPIMSELIATLSNMTDPDHQTIVNLCLLTNALKKMSSEEKSSIVGIVKVMSEDDSSKKRNKKDKDNSKPKRAANMFQNYCKEHRNDIMKNNPEYKFVDIQKMLGVNWGLRSVDKQQEYKIPKDIPADDSVV